MMLLWKAVVLEMGVKAHSQTFWFAENLGKIPENPGKNGTKRCLTSKTEPKVCRKTHEDRFWRSHQKKVLMIFAGETLQVKVAQITFRASLGTCGQKIAPPKCACSYTFYEKAPSSPLPPFLKGQEGKGPAMPPFSGVPVHIILYALSLLVVVSCKVSL